MPSPLRLLFPPALVVVLIVGVVVRDSEHDPPSPTPGARQAFAGATLPAGVRAHDFTLSDQQGRRVSLNAYRGQVVALVLLPVPLGVSPHCRTCVLVAQQLRGALDELESHPPAKPGVQTIFVSTKAAAPRARVGHLLRETSLTGRVEYLTGTPTELQPLWHAYGIPTPGASKAGEAAVTVLLIDRNGFERVGFGLEQITPEGLAHDIRLLQAG